jgi:hypothetical protein
LPSKKSNPFFEFDVKAGLGSEKLPYADIIARRFPFAEPFMSLIS